MSLIENYYNFVTYNSIKLKLDIIHIAQIAYLEDILNMLAFSASDLCVYCLVERVTRNAQNVQILSVLVEPVLLDSTAVRYDRYAFEFKALFGVLDEFAEKLRVEERFSAREIQLLHAVFFEQSNSLFGLFQLHYV